MSLCFSVDFDGQVLRIGADEQIYFEISTKQEPQLLQFYSYASFICDISGFCEFLNEKIQVILHNRRSQRELESEGNPQTQTSNSPEILFKILISTPPAAPHSYYVELTRVFFQSNKSLSHLILLPQPLLSLYAMGIWSGVVIWLGQDMYIYPCTFDYLLTHAIVHCERGSFPFAEEAAMATSFKSLESFELCRLYTPEKLGLPSQYSLTSLLATSYESCPISLRKTTFSSFLIDGYRAHTPELVQQIGKRIQHQFGEKIPTLNIYSRFDVSQKSTSWWGASIMSSIMDHHLAPWSRKSFENRCRADLSRVEQNLSSSKQFTEQDQEDDQVSSQSSPGLVFTYPPSKSLFLAIRYRTTPKNKKLADEALPSSLPTKEKEFQEFEQKLRRERDFQKRDFEYQLCEYLNEKISKGRVPSLQTIVISFIKKERMKDPNLFALQQLEDVLPEHLIQSLNLPDPMRYLGTPSKCGLCKAIVHPYDMAHHKECLGVTRCPVCHRILQRQSLASHLQNYCPKYVVLCPYHLEYPPCLFQSSMRDLDVHLNEVHRDRTWLPVPVPGQYLDPSQNLLSSSDPLKSDSIEIIQTIPEPQAGTGPGLEMAWKKDSAYWKKLTRKRNSENRIQISEKVKMITRKLQRVRFLNGPSVWATVLINPRVGTSCFMCNQEFVQGDRRLNLVGEKVHQPCFRCTLCSRILCGREPPDSISKHPLKKPDHYFVYMGLPWCIEHKAQLPT